jgi:hypothetical protein
MGRAIMANMGGKYDQMMFNTIFLLTVSSISSGIQQ